MASNAEAPKEPPKAYSQNPSTIRARRRKSNMTAEAKVQEKAQTADYKALVQARKAAMGTDEFKEASKAKKELMLKSVMLKIMEKRRAKRQDAKSKMEDYDKTVRAARAQVAEEIQPENVTQFLRNNDFFPSDDRKMQMSVNAMSSDIRADLMGQLRASMGLGLGMGFMPPYPMQMPLPMPMPMHMSMPPGGMEGVDQMPLFSGEPPCFPTPGPEAFAACKTPMAGMFNQGATPGPQASRGLLSNAMGTGDVVLAGAEDIMSVRKNVEDLEHAVQKTNESLSQLRREVMMLKGGHTETGMQKLEEAKGTLETMVHDLESQPGKGSVKEIAKMREVMTALQEALGH